MRYEDVVAKLRSVSLAGKSIRLVVARVMNSRVEEELGVPPEINDVRERLHGHLRTVCPSTSF